MHSQLYKGCTRLEGVLNVLGETDPVTRRMNNSARGENSEASDEASEVDCKELETLKGCSAPCHVHGRWLPCGWWWGTCSENEPAFPETRKPKGNKQKKAHGLSPTFSRRNLTFVTFLGEFTFLGPRPEPSPLRRSSVSQRLESATPFVYADALGHKPSKLWPRSARWRQAPWSTQETE